MQAIAGVNDDRTLANDKAFASRGVSTDPLGPSFSGSNDGLILGGANSTRYRRRPRPGR